MSHVDPGPPLSVPGALLPSPAESVIFQRLPGGAVLLSTADEIYFGLNTVGAELWELLPPVTATVEALCGVLAERYPEAGMARIREDVDSLLGELARAGLVHEPERG